MAQKQKDKKIKEVNPIGRPSLYSKEVCDKICEIISTSSEGLHVICKKDDSLPSATTIMNWLLNPEHKEFIEQYARAREKQADFLASEIIEISDDTSNDYQIDSEGNVRENKEFVSRSRLRVDARKWVASKLAPKKYGDKLDLTNDGEKFQPVTIQNLTPDQIKALNESIERKF